LTYYYCKKLSSLKRLLRTTSATRRSKTANITKRWYYFAAHRQNVTNVWCDFWRYWCL